MCVCECAFVCMCVRMHVYACVCACVHMNRPWWLESHCWGLVMAMGCSDSVQCCCMQPVAYALQELLAPQAAAECTKHMIWRSSWLPHAAAACNQPQVLLAELHHMVASEDPRNGEMLVRLVDMEYVDPTEDAAEAASYKDI